MPPPRRRSRWAAAPATYILVGINCGVFLAMVAQGASIWMPTLDQLMRWGADRPDNILIHGEWWRIVTAMFVHVGIIHLATNMWCLWNLGLLAEPLMGSLGLIAAYILTGAAGNLLSTGLELAEADSRATGTPLYLAGAGASGAVFGIAGALHCVAQNEAPARAAARTLASAPLCHLFRSHQSRHRLLRQLRQRVHRHRSRQLRPHRRFSLRIALCRATGAAHRLTAQRNPNENAVGGHHGDVGLLVLFGFYIAHVAPPQKKI